MSPDKLDNDGLISRRLDDALSEEESLELDRAMLRDPELRETFEAYQRVDALACEALLREGIARQGPLDLDAITGARRVVRRRRPHRGWLLIPGAIAAALAALIVPRPDLSRPTQPRLVETLPVMPPTRDRSPESAPIHGDLYRNVNTMKRNTGRDIIGVMGEDGNIYWIEVDRTRTVTLPPRSSFATDPRL